MTPRHVYLARRAYERRRGWMAWHIALLSRADLSKAPLEVITGDAARRPAQTPEQMQHAMKMWTAAINAREQKV